MKKDSTKYITTAAIIAALYTSLTFMLAPLSFGPIQIRISEALTILPAVCPPSVLGLTLGCFLSNIIGFASGLNPLGIVDSIVGTSATLIAALLTYAISRKAKGISLYILAPLPPIIINGIFVGCEIAYFINKDFTFMTAFIAGLYVAIGEILPCYLGGILLLKKGEKFFEKHFPTIKK